MGSRVTESRDVAVSDLVLDERYQPRCFIDRDVVEEYAELYAGGTILPAPSVHEVDGSLYVVDGWHRTLAAQRAGFGALSVSVEVGSDHETALACALSANSDHGLRRTRRDQARAVRLAVTDPALGKRTARDLARLLRVSERTITTYRAEARKVAELNDRREDPPEVKPPKKVPIRTTLDEDEPDGRLQPSQVVGMQRLVRYLEALADELKALGCIDSSGDVVEGALANLGQAMPEALADPTTWLSPRSVSDALDRLDDLRDSRIWE